MSVQWFISFFFLFIRFIKHWRYKEGRTLSSPKFSNNGTSSSCMCNHNSYTRMPVMTLLHQFSRRFHAPKEFSEKG